MKISESAKKAVFIGTLCSVAYLAVYVVRNILSAVTPQMIAAGFSEEYIGMVSSMFLAFYAVGQLINGIIGDKIKAKWMISMGLLGSGVCNLLFSYFPVTPVVAPLAYGMAGFFLSMIYGPMTKVVAENTEPLHAVRCSLGYTFASFFGSPAAGLLAAFLVWQSVFAIGSTLLVVMAVLIVIFFAMFERKGIVKYGQYKPQEKGLKNVKVLFKYQIVKFSLVSLLTGIIRTSVVFWLPTYISQYLGFSASDAALVFTVATLIISFTTFIAVFVYERLGRDMNKSVLVMFVTATAFFLMTYFIKYSMLNIVCIVLAIMASNGAASILWSIYCPSLRDTGMVSGATGFLDFLSYAAAAIANIVFASAATDIGWGNLILVWTGIAAVGIVVALPYEKMKKKEPINN